MTRDERIRYLINLLLREMPEKWAYWSRYIFINRYEGTPRPVYDNLLRLVRDRDYFALITNVDHCSQKAGFDKARLLYTQWNYGLFQCSNPCHQKTYDNEAAVRRMVSEQKDMCVPFLAYDARLAGCGLCLYQSGRGLRSCRDRGPFYLYQRGYP